MTFLGRPAKRKDSQLRREQLLQATLDIIAQSGIREVRHRAVAERAGVPLSATTYYFADIHILLHDALLFFLQQGMPHINEIQQQALRLASSPDQHLPNALTQQLTRYVNLQVDDERQRRIELAFRECALRVPQLAAAQRDAQQAMLTAIEPCLRLFHSAQVARQRAHILMGTLQHLEYQRLLGADVDVHSVIGQLVNSMIAPQT